jgi:hypothetical protein
MKISSTARGRQPLAVEVAIGRRQAADELLPQFPLGEHVGRRRGDVPLG